MVEDAHAELEGRAIPIIRRIELEEDLPAGEDLRTLLKFVAHLVTRVPHHRQWLADVMNQVGKFELEMAAGTPERFAERLSAMKAAGVNVDEISLERALSRDGWSASDAFAPPDASVGCWLPLPGSRPGQDPSRGRGPSPGFPRCLMCDNSECPCR